MGGWCIGIALTSEGSLGVKLPGFHRTSCSCLHVGPDQFLAAWKFPPIRLIHKALSIQVLRMASWAAGHTACMVQQPNKQKTCLPALQPHEQLSGLPSHLDAWGRWCGDPCKRHAISQRRKPKRPGTRAQLPWQVTPDIPPWPAYIPACLGTEGCSATLDAHACEPGKEDSRNSNPSHIHPSQNKTAIRCLCVKSSFGGGGSVGVNQCLPSLPLLSKRTGKHTLT